MSKSAAKPPELHEFAARQHRTAEGSSNREGGVLKGINFSLARAGVIDKKSQFQFGYCRCFCFSTSSYLINSFPTILEKFCNFCCLVMLDKQDWQCHFRGNLGTDDVIAYAAQRTDGNSFWVMMVY